MFCLWNYIHGDLGFVSLLAWLRLCFEYDDDGGGGGGDDEGGGGDDNDDDDDDNDIVIFKPEMSIGGVRCDVKHYN